MDIISVRMDILMKFTNTWHVRSFQVQDYSHEVPRFMPAHLLLLKDVYSCSTDDLDGRSYRFVARTTLNKVKKSMASLGMSFIFPNRCCSKIHDVSIGVEGLYFHNIVLVHFLTFLLVFVSA